VGGLQDKNYFTEKQKENEILKWILQKRIMRMWNEFKMCWFLTEDTYTTVRVQIFISTKIHEDGGSMFLRNVGTNKSTRCYNPEEHNMNFCRENHKFCNWVKIRRVLEHVVPKFEFQNKKAGFCLPAAHPSKIDFSTVVSPNTLRAVLHLNHCGANLQWSERRTA
jgi:hypothetical protein